MTRPELRECMGCTAMLMKVSTMGTHHETTLIEGPCESCGLAEGHRVHTEAP